MPPARHAEVVVVGGGVVGLSTGLLLARDGHRVRLLERDPAPPPPPGADAWKSWKRRGVYQFRLLHGFLPRFRELLDAELPDVTPALEAGGALRFNRIHCLPEAVTGGWRPGDERFDAVTGRRPMVEATLARLVAEQPGIEVLRGAAVRGVLCGDRRHAAAPHVTGVLLDDGSERRGDLVVDASGRRTQVPTLLAAIGAAVPQEAREDIGNIYYSRHFRSSDGSIPDMPASLLQHYESISILTAPGDNGTWGVVIFTSSRDHTGASGARSGHLVESGQELPDGGALARRRADHRHRRDGGAPRRSPLLVVRRRAGGHRTARRRRRLGVQQPGTRARGVDRHDPCRRPP